MNKNLLSHFVSKFEKYMSPDLATLNWIESKIIEIWDLGFDAGQNERSENDWDDGYKQGRKDEKEDY